MIADNPLPYVIDSQFVVKVFLVLFLVFYFFFSVLLIRQVQIMAVAIQTDLNKVLKSITFVHFAAAVVLLIFAVFV